MLTHMAQISETLTHLINPIAEQACRKILDQLALSDVVGPMFQMVSDIRASSKSWERRFKPKVKSETSFKGVIKYNPVSTGLKYDVSLPGQHMDAQLMRSDTFVTNPLFFDPTHNIVLFERFHPANIQVDCSLTFIDRVQGYDAINRFHSLFNRGEYFQLQDFTTNYPLPPEHLVALNKLAKLAGIEKGCFGQWLTACSKDRITWEASKRLRNRTYEVVVKYDTFEAMVYIDYTPEALQIDSPGKAPQNLVLNFQLTIQFSRPDRIYMRYPIVIHNQLIPDSLITSDRRDAYNDTYDVLHHRFKGIDEAHQMFKEHARKPKRLPWYDDWLVPRFSSFHEEGAEAFLIGVVLQDTEPVMTGKLEDPKPPEYTTVDLTSDIDNYYLSTDVVAYFEKNLRDCLKPEALYNIGVYIGDRQVSPNCLKFDGHVLSIPNSIFDHDKICRLVLSRTPPRAEGNNPWFFVLKCVIEVGDVGRK